MTESPTHDATLRARTEDLAEALEIAGPRLDDATSRRVTAAVDGVRQRLALGVDHTVVAFAGGTGSGKSSLFNKVSRLSFADVGVKRPTTARVTACSWSDDAEALLDWVGVDRERRITQGGELDGVGEEKLAGLVLLDLPDHDSVEPAHREVVDRVLPLVDLLVWVVDPQKYADDALHSGYLRDSVGSESSMVVLLNQVDTVPDSQRDNLLQDLARLLEDDGLTGVYGHIKDLTDTDRDIALDPFDTKVSLIVVGGELAANGSGPLSIDSPLSVELYRVSMLAPTKSSGISFSGVLGDRQEEILDLLVRQKKAVLIDPVERQTEMQD